MYQLGLFALHKSRLASDAVQSRCRRPRHLSDSTLTATIQHGRMVVLVEEVYIFRYRDFHKTLVPSHCWMACTNAVPHKSHF